MMRHLASGRWLLLLLLLAVGCVAPGENLRGLADQPPLDLAVLVTGGAFHGPGSGGGTFAGAPLADEAIPAATVVEALRRGRVFRRVEIDPDLARRRTISGRLATQRRDDDVHAFLREARAQGFDMLLVIEQLQDGPIEAQGTNGRWPVTLATWLLLGVGLLIPDRTFESRATLRCTMRDLQSGRALLDPPLLFAGPIDLSLVERTDFLGLCQSIVVPPFWVGDDEAVMGAAVRATTESRLLLSLVRELKGESSRRRLLEAVPAEIALQDGQVLVWSGEGVADVRLRAPVPAAAAAAFTRELLGSVVLVERSGVRRFHYRAPLPPLAADSELQVLVSTVSGAVASMTAVVEAPQ